MNNSIFYQNVKSLLTLVFLSLFLTSCSENEIQESNFELTESIHWNNDELSENVSIQGISENSSVNLVNDFALQRVSCECNISMMLEAVYLDDVCPGLNITVRMDCDPEDACDLYSFRLFTNNDERLITANPPTIVSSGPYAVDWNDKIVGGSQTPIENNAVTFYIPGSTTFTGNAGIELFEVC